MIKEPVDLSAFKPEYPAPPRLNWVWLLLAQVFVSTFMMVALWHSHRQTSALVVLCAIVSFAISNGWLLIQILWFHSVNRNSVAFRLYLICIVLNAISQIMGLVHPQHGMIFNLILLAICVFFIYTNFVFRRELQKHYNEIEPIGLRLTGAMTFFFALFYFQYHFRKIALLKDEAAAMPAPPTA
jgi:hypothetical protein